MNILIDNSTEFEFDIEKEALINRVVAETLILEGFSENIEVSISIVDGREIKELNKKFRNTDKETDVLSFPLMDFEVCASGLIMLGDIVINIEMAVIRAKEYNHSFERELGFLTAHSMLHLLGYDHMSQADEEKMFKKQEQILMNSSLKRD